MTIKKVYFVVSSMQGGGAERVAALLSNFWQQTGYQVTLIVTFSGRGKCIYPLDDKVKLVFLADDSKTKKILPFNKVERLNKLRNIIKSNKPDLIVSFLPIVNIAAIIANFGTKIPLIVSERIYPPADATGFAIVIARRFLYGRASLVVVQTKKSLRWVEQNCYGAKVAVIANPLVLPLPATEPKVIVSQIINPDRKIILAVGRLEWQKGFDLLIKAFSQIYAHQQQWDLVILGEGEQKKALKQLVNQNRLSGRVFMPGRVGNLADWYSHANIFTLSSRYEGFPNVMLEAMAFGLPTISFDCDTGPKEIIQHEVNGLLVPLSKGVEGLQSGLLQLMKNEKLCKSMGVAAQSVREKYSIENISRSWSDNFDNLSK